MKPIEGEPAFPSPPVGTGDPRDGMTTGHAGLSERRYYIGQALQGFCANPNFSHAQADDIALLVLHQADHIMKALYPQPKKPNNEKQIRSTQRISILARRLAKTLCRILGRE